MAKQPESLYWGEPLDSGDLAEELVQDAVPDDPVNQGEVDLLSQGSGLMKVGEDGLSCLQLPAPGANNFNKLEPVAPGILLLRRRYWRSWSIGVLLQ